MATVDPGSTDPPPDAPASDTTGTGSGPPTAPGSPGRPAARSAGRADGRPAGDAHHHPPGYLGDKDKVLARLRRIEGQVRGIQRMVDEDTYCIDVLTQVAAATRALQNVAIVLLDDHVRHCVADDVGSGSSEKVDEAMAAIARLVRS